MQAAIRSTTSSSTYPYDDDGPCPYCGNAGKVRSGNATGSKFHIHYACGLQLERDINSSLYQIVYPCDGDEWNPFGDLTDDKVEEKEVKPHKCTCSMQLLLREGCKCGGV